MKCKSLIFLKQQKYEYLSSPLHHPSHCMAGMGHPKFIVAGI